MLLYHWILSLALLQLLPINVMTRREQQWHKRFPRQSYVAASHQNLQRKPLYSQRNQFPWSSLSASHSQLPANQFQQYRPHFPHQFTHSRFPPPISTPRWSHQGHIPQRLAYLPPVSNAIINNPTPFARPSNGHLPLKYARWPIAGNHPPNLSFTYRKPKTILVYLIPAINQRQSSIIRHSLRYYGGMSPNNPLKITNTPVYNLSSVNKYFPFNTTPTISTPYSHNIPTNNLISMQNETQIKQLSSNPITKMSEIYSVANESMAHLNKNTSDNINNETINSMSNAVLTKETLNQTSNEFPTQEQVTTLTENMNIKQDTNKLSMQTKRDALDSDSESSVDSTHVPNAKKVDVFSTSTTTEIPTSSEKIDYTNIPEDSEVNLTTSTDFDHVDESEALNDSELNLSSTMQLNYYSNYSTETMDFSNVQEDSIKPSLTNITLPLQLIPKAASKSIIIRNTRLANITNKNKRSHPYLNRAKPNSAQKGRNKTSEFIMRLIKDSEDATDATDETDYDLDDDYSSKYDYSDDDGDTEDYDQSTDYEYDDSSLSSTASAEVELTNKPASRSLSDNKMSDDGDVDEKAESMELPFFDDNVAEPKKVNAELEQKSKIESLKNKGPNKEENKWEHPDSYYDEEESIMPVKIEQDDTSDLKVAPDVYEDRGLFDGPYVNSQRDSRYSHGNNKVFNSALNISDDEDSVTHSDHVSHHYSSH